MEATYGIGIKNRFDLFYDETGDSYQIMHKVEQNRRREEKENRRKNREKVVVVVEDEEQQEKEKPSPTKNKVSDADNKKVTKEMPSTPKAQEESTVPKKDESKPKAQQSSSEEKAVEKKPVVEKKPLVSFHDDPPRDVEEKKNRRNREDRASNSSTDANLRDRFDSDRDLHMEGEGMRRGRGGPRGGFAGSRGRGFRGGRGGSGFDSRGKREFDRQSGSDRSGVKAVDKRDGAGPHNWGTIRDELDQLNISDEASDWADRSDVISETRQRSNKKSGDPSADEGDENKAPPVVEEAKLMTLDEWRKEQEKTRAVPQYNLRKAGEGEDPAQWKPSVARKKKTDDEQSARRTSATNQQQQQQQQHDDAEEVREKRRRETASGGRQLIDIEIKYNDSRRLRGRGRGGARVMNRGGFGGGGGVGPGDDEPRVRENPFGGPNLVRGSRNARGWRGSAVVDNPVGGQIAPRVNDKRDFPSLG